MTHPDLQQRHVLVTGGAGFIGSHLVDALIQRGAEVRVLDNLSTGSAANLEHCRGSIDWLEADLRDLDACQRACEGVELVFHQAALGSVPRSMADPATSLAVNLGGTANVFSAARDSGVRRIVYASSSSVYGDSDELPKREGSEGRVLSPYAASKRFCEELGELFSRAFEIEIVGLRYFNVYGPRQSPEGPYAAVVPRFFRAGLAGEPMEIFGDGEQSRDFTYVSDAVRANLLAAEAPASTSGRAFNVAGGRRVTVNEIAREIAAVVGSDLEPRHREERSGDVRHSLADLERAGAELGYRAEVGLADGLSRCRDYYEKIFSLNA